MVRMVVLVSCVTFFGIGAIPVEAQDEWPQWRGPSGQGHATAQHLPETWSKQQNIVWSRNLPGRGWSSPVVTGNQIWVTAAVETPATPEEIARLKAMPGGQPLSLSSSISLHALCVDFTTGKLLHDIELFREESPQPIHSLNSYASPSPVFAEGRLFCHFGAHGTACLDVETREVLWVQRGIKLNHENGPGSTPVLWKGRLIIQCDGSDRQSIIALDVVSGQIAWETARSGELHQNPQFKKAYGTPLVIRLDEQDQLISPGANWLYSYNPENGDELWRISYEVLGFSVVPRPVFGVGKIFFSTSFLQPELLAVDVTGAQPKIAWRCKRQAPTMPSPLLIGEELYMVSERGIMTCLNANTGEAHWTARLEGNFSSSPLFADGKIYVGNRDGQVFVLRPGREFNLIATNELDSALMASPVALRESLIFRSEESLYRIQAESK
ncbi:MAG: PQQ-binding-like beta-propeller repeat protein [Planctomycetota bacterium]|nr:PQQ-binding-like beta-propeller repeat protein [Planctomycetota bacterium]